MEDPTAYCSVSLRSNSGSVHCIKHNYPDHRDKSERKKRGQRHRLLPVVGLWTEARSRSPPSLSRSRVFNRFGSFANRIRLSANEVATSVALWQPGKVHSNPSGLIFAEQLGRRTSPMVFLEVEVAECLAISVGHDEASVVIFNCPW